MCVEGGVQGLGRGGGGGGVSAFLQTPSGLSCVFH